MEAINWNDPAARGRLMEEIGPDAYNKAFCEHIKRDAVATVNGYPIVSITSRFGRLFQVFGTGDAFTTQAQAEAHATKLEPNQPNEYGV